MAIFLTRLVLGPRNRLVQRDLSDIQQLHRTVMSAFPDSGGQGRLAHRVLFRVEEALGGREINVLVQSITEPSWSLPEGYLRQPPEVKNIDPALDSVSAGGHLRFRLEANPTRKVVKETDGVRAKNGMRVPIRTDAGRREWLDHKAEAAGFHVLSVDARPAGTRTGSHSQRPGRLSLESVRFDGLLEVLDPALLRQAIQNGLGSGKAYGHGLLSVAPG